jgi:hypothetical protein
MRPQPKASIYFTISGHDSFPSRLTRKHREAGRRLFMCALQEHSRCMATTAVSHKLGSPRGFRRSSGCWVFRGNSGNGRDLDFGLMFWKR